MEKFLPSLPAKRYFTIGEVSHLCGVKSHVLRYWEQEFTQLRPMKRRGNRRYYQHHEVLMIRRIRDLLYDQGFTVNGARNKLLEIDDSQSSQPSHVPATLDKNEVIDSASPSLVSISVPRDYQVDFLVASSAVLPKDTLAQQRLQLVRSELFEIRDLLNPSLPKAC